MISDEQARKIVERLLERTRAQQVNWRPDEDQAEDGEVTGFYVLFPKSSITVSFNSPVAEPDTIDIAFRNDSDYIVKRWVVEEGDPDWSLVRSLYDEAGSCVLGWDGVLSDIENAIDTGGKIGLSLDA